MVVWKHKQWFASKGGVGAYLASAPYALEMRKRLQWLKEGCLEYHMTQFQSRYFGPQGNPEEKKLYAEFLELTNQKDELWSRP